MLLKYKLVADSVRNILVDKGEQLAVEEIHFPYDFIALKNQSLHLQNLYREH